jgi:hypothetical protein
LIFDLVGYKYEFQVQVEVENARSTLKHFNVHKKHSLPFKLSYDWT